MGAGGNGDGRKCRQLAALHKHGRHTHRLCRDVPSTGGGIKDADWYDATRSRDRSHTTRYFANSSGGPRT